MITDYYFYLTAIPAILIYGLAKGGLGASLGVIAVPLMALTGSPVQAAAVLLPILCVMDIFAIKAHWRHADMKEIRFMLPSALVGILFAYIIIDFLPRNYVSILVGIISISFALQFLFFKKKKAMNKFLSSCLCMLSGLSSAMIHSGGGPITVYLIPKGMDKKVLIGTMAVFFGLLNYIKIIPYSLAGSFNAENLSTSLILIPLAPIGVKLGTMLLDVIDQELLYKICYILLLISGTKLLYTGIFG